MWFDALESTIHAFDCSRLELKALSKLPLCANDPEATTEG